MEIRRIKGVKRIIIPQSAQPAGATGAIQLKAKGRKRRKLSKSSKLLEKLTRHSANAGSSIYDRYLSKHKRSNRKKKDGWLKDLNKNVFGAVRKGRKEFKLSTLF